MITETKYQIVAKCNPYHAKFHHHGEKVIRRDGATPVEWVADDNFGQGFSESEALDRLWKLALAEMERHGDLCREDDASFEEWISTLMEDQELTREEAKNSLSWYRGEGIYYGGSYEPMMLKGDRYYTYDTMTYEAAEIEEEDGDDDF